MGVETILVAVGEDDRDRTDAIASAVIDIAEPTGATAVLTHVMTERTYEEAIERATEFSDESDEGELPEWIERWSHVGTSARPGIEGDVPEWIERWWLTEPDVERETHPDALQTIVERKDLIQALAAALYDAGIDYEVSGQVGDPAEHVISLAEERTVDFVVVGGQNRSPARQALFGSVSQQILRSVSCPVISVREPAES